MKFSPLLDARHLLRVAVDLLESGLMMRTLVSCPRICGGGAALPYQVDVIILDSTQEYLLRKEAGSRHIEPCQQFLEGILADYFLSGELNRLFWRDRWWNYFEGRGTTLLKRPFS